MIQVNRKEFPKIIPDNDENYLAQLHGVVESVDDYASLEITKAPKAYYFRVAPSLPKYIPMLLEEILKLHTMYNIHLDLSKSIKSSSTISFKISFEY